MTHLDELLELGIVVAIGLALVALGIALRTQRALDTFTGRRDWAKLARNRVL